MTSIDEDLLRRYSRLREAGDALAAAAHRVQAEGDGIHRLCLAIAGWYQALADERETEREVRG
jgi:hypothetical protein